MQCTHQFKQNNLQVTYVTDRTQRKIWQHMSLLAYRRMTSVKKYVAHSMLKVKQSLCDGEANHHSLLSVKIIHLLGQITYDLRSFLPSEGGPTSLDRSTHHMFDCVCMLIEVHDKNVCYNPCNYAVPPKHINIFFF